MNAFDPFAYLDAASAALGLTIPPADREAVAANLMRLQRMACEVIDFRLPAPAEPDPLRDDTALMPLSSYGAEPATPPTRDET